MIILILLFLALLESKSLEIQDSTTSFTVNLSKKTTRINNITIPQQVYDQQQDYTLKTSINTVRIPVCLLKSARYQYTLTVIWDWDQILKVDLAVPATDCLKEVRPRSGKFKITIKSLDKEIGKRPLLLEWKEQEIKQGHESFWIKYWYIIVPVLLFLFMPIPGEKL